MQNVKRLGKLPQSVTPVLNYGHLSNVWRYFICLFGGYCFSWVKVKDVIKHAAVRRGSAPHNFSIQKQEDQNQLGLAQATQTKEKYHNA